MNELKIVLNKCNTNSIPGLDGVGCLILKRFPEELKRLLLALFNEISQKKVFPSEWREYLVFFIPKSGSNKVRPISLASCLLKIFERILHIRLS
ncbi:GSCOCG00008557001-RA-CDS [Cotesia congregata]|nr:GSCOCG00008557001-RA-CDS [Cotesia congregata]